jgi:hypothetical protein
MLYKCDICNYSTNNSGNFSHHKKTKKHLIFISKKSNNEHMISHIITVDDNNYHIDDNKKTTDDNEKLQQKFECNICKTIYTHKSNLSRHKKKCQEQENDKKNNELFNNTNKVLIEKDYQLKILEKEKEFIEKMEKEKTELLKEKTEFINNFMANANVLLNKANDNTKITAQTLQTVSFSALKYANEKFKNTPALLPLQNFNINNLDFDNEEDKKQLVELLIYNAKQKSLDKLLGDHIVKYYKKDKPEEQSFHTTDCSRLNYIVRELIENALTWNVDKNGLKICKDIVKPLIKKCINALMEHQKFLLEEMENRNYIYNKTVTIIIDVIMEIDSGSLESDINKYIAPFFNLNKNI